jgi:hypothetical protein
VNAGDGPLLPDGTYEAFVVDVGSSDPGDHDVRSVEIVVVSGPHKGEVVTVRARGLRGSEFDLMGMPATLVVVDGRPTVTIDS